MDARALCGDIFCSETKNTPSRGQVLFSLTISEDISVGIRPNGAKIGQTQDRRRADL